MRNVRGRRGWLSVSGGIQEFAGFLDLWQSKLNSETHRQSSFQLVCNNWLLAAELASCVCVTVDRQSGLKYHVLHDHVHAG